MQEEVAETVVIEQGVEEWKRKRNDADWLGWLRIGAALVVLRTQAMRRAGNYTTGRHFNAVMRDLLAETGFKEIDKAVRSNLVAVMDNLPKIEEWRKNRLTLGERLRYNHPTTVMRRWRASTIVPDPNAPNKPSPYTVMHDGLVEAEERTHAAEEAAKRAGSGSNIDFDNDKIPDMARFLAHGLVTARRVRQLIKALDTMAKQMEKANAA
jgi:hypothetical protein